MIVDEAHKMSAYRYGEKTDETDRYRLGKTLSKNSENLLFLTATPHKGDPENFRLFLDLLQPGFFATNEMLQESIKNKDNPLFIRRVKEDLKDFEGKPIFLPRNVKTTKFNLSQKEKTLYNDVSRYVNEEYNKALTRDTKRNVAFALVILQRRLASSTAALLKSLERRKDRLEDLREKTEIRSGKELKTFDYEETEDESEEERWKEEEIWETLSVAENMEELKKEIETLGKLIEKAREVVSGEDEVKLTELKKTLKELNTKFPGKKVIIFTESRDTLEYLERKTKGWGYLVSTIHGGMKLEERIDAEKVFKNETQILIATEAAGEGINLQFCNLMINYDLPWNPNRLEQRMGRIHRYGQNYEVYVFNLVAADTREGMVLAKLFEKLDEIRRALNNDKVFDVISDVIYGKDLAQLMLEAAANARDINQILKDIEIKIDKEYIEKVKENLGESLATKYIDYTRIKEVAEKAKENKLIPEYTEAFFLKAFSSAEGRFRQRKDGFWSIESIPYEIKAIADEDAFKKKYGSLLKAYPKATFDKEKAFKNSDAELLTFGQPLFEAVLEYAERTYTSDLKKGAVYTDPEGKLSGYILFYEGEIRDGTEKTAGKRLFAIYTDGKETKPMPSTILWDLAEGKGKEEKADIEALEQKALTRVLPEMELYRNKILKEREREAGIKEKYGIKSLETLMVKLDGELIDLYSRKEKGENVDLPIRNKEEAKKKYDKALIDLKEQITREKTLTMVMPRFIGIIKVMPAEKVAEYMKSDPEIERIGMETAKEYETKNNRNPEDVSLENLGFDIRSSDLYGKTRYIEVKARAHTGPIALTQNEWFKAKRFGSDYYLYVVLNAATKPELSIIQNPAEKLSPDERVEIVRYVVPYEQIKEKSRKEG